MRVVLEVSSGPELGRKTMLRARQIVRVGRTDRSDFVLGADEQLSSRHFLVECDDRSCQLRDLESTNGTFVNGQQVGSTRLRDGDEIYVGQSVIRVSIEAAPALDDWIDEPRTVAFPTALLRMPVKCTQRECRSGLAMVESEQAEPAPFIVAHRIATLATGYAIVDFRRLEMESDEQSAAAPTLLDGLPPEALAAVSPRIIALGNAQPLIEQGWGKDGLAIVYSRSDPESVVAQLKMASSYDPGTRRSQPGRGMLAFHWPSIGRMLLEHTPPAALQGMLGDVIEGLLYEGLAPTVWQLLCRPSLAGQLPAAGFQIQATS